ncbi:DUF4156 domain-containing protein [Vibrio sp. VB16]|uniref:DUF4156 domain-containing protein n=1 Tax=Vibrio sp. VB16 TaxID=2785746 RepID=UPI0018A0017F|nr:DUF4156 domain-containing protein [Vibrio sp. VB16]UGA55540.1 DUF4156 domain-containing protein [Vibrio sp. VB16]
MIKWFSFFCVSFLVGCSIPSKVLLSEASQVHIRTDSVYRFQYCEWRGEVTGNEGHWYSYLFFANDTMIRGALNEMKNHAHEIGANTVFLLSPIDFATSVTFVGTAYLCNYPDGDLSLPINIINNDLN